MKIFDTQRYRSNLKRSSKRFAAHNFLYQLATEDIAQRIIEFNRNFSHILEIGSRGLLCNIIGDASYYIQTNLEINLLPKNNKLVICDNEMLPFNNNFFDLIVSVMELHFANDLPGVFAQILRCLTKDGVAMISILGGKTLCELRKTLVAAELECNLKTSPHIAPMADIQDLTGLMQRIGFSDIVVDTEVISVAYENVISLMRDLRYMGQGNILLQKNNVSFNKKFLSKLEKIYAEQFLKDNLITASFEIITLTGTSNG